MYIGAMGGLNPPTEPSPKAVFPPKEGVPGFQGQLHMGMVAMVSIPRRATLFPSSPPPDGPPNLGIARIRWGVFLVAIVPISHRFIWTFLGDLFLVNSRSCIHT